MIDIGLRVNFKAIYIDSDDPKDKDDFVALFKRLQKSDEKRKEYRRKELIKLSDGLCGDIGDQI